MKKYLLSLAILIALSISAKAQFSFGVKAGPNFSSLNTENLHDSPLAGFQAGVFARFGTGFYVQPELYLASSGGKFQSNDDDFNGQVRFTTLNVPLLFGETFGTPNLNFRIMAGPVYTYLENTDESLRTNIDAAYADFGHYNNSTLGYQVGAGVDVQSITIDLRYEGGLSKLNSDFGQRANIWSLSVGFKIL
jgi:hypothetical protein